MVSTLYKSETATQRKFSIVGVLDCLFRSGGAGLTILGKELVIMFRMSSAVVHKEGPFFIVHCRLG